MVKKPKTLSARMIEDLKEIKHLASKLNPFPNYRSV